MYTLQIKVVKILQDLVESEPKAYPKHQRGGWMSSDFTGFFNITSVISGRCLDDNEMLYTIELRLRLRRFRLQWGTNPVR